MKTVHQMLGKIWIGLCAFFDASLCLGIYRSSIVGVIFDVLGFVSAGALLFPRRYLTFLAVVIAASAHAQILVANYSSNTVGEYTTDGATLNASLITVDHPPGLAISGNHIVVSYDAKGNGVVGKYNLDGSTVNSSLISVAGNETCTGLAVSGNDIFVANYLQGTVGEYTTDGAVVNASLISGLIAPNGVRIIGNNLFVCSYGTVGEYTLTGQVVNGSLIKGRPDDRLYDIAFNGNNFFVAGFDSGTVGEYTTSGATVNASLISSGQQGSFAALAFLGNNLLVANFAANTVSEYSTDGTVVNGSFITGLSNPFALVVVPEPTALALVGLGVAGLMVSRLKYTLN